MSNNTKPVLKAKSRSKETDEFDKGLLAIFQDIQTSLTAMTNMAKLMAANGVNTEDPRYQQALADIKLIRTEANETITKANEIRANNDGDLMEYFSLIPMAESIAMKAENGPQMLLNDIWEETHGDKK